MPDIVLDQVDDIDLAWPLLAEQFERAFKRLPTQLTLAEIRERAGEGRVALWAIYERDKPLPLLAALATCVRPRQVCEILVLAGHDTKRWLKPALMEFEALARAHGMDRIQFWGRPGWARLMPDYTVMTATGRKYLLEKTLC